MVASRNRPARAAQALLQQSLNEPSSLATPSSSPASPASASTTPTSSSDPLRTTAAERQALRGRLLGGEELSPVLESSRRSSSTTSVATTNGTSSRPVPTAAPRRLAEAVAASGTTQDPEEPPAARTQTTLGSSVPAASAAPPVASTSRFDAAARSAREAEAAARSAREAPRLQASASASASGVITAQTQSDAIRRDSTDVITAQPAPSPSLASTDADEEPAEQAHAERLRILMTIRRQAFLIEVIEELNMQMRMAVAAREAAEEEELMTALARSVEETHGGGFVSPAAPAAISGAKLAFLDASLPSRPFHEARGFLLGGESAYGGFECAVCIAEFESKDECRVLGCMHCFHSSCIDKWLGRSEACPTCKQPVLFSS